MKSKLELIITKGTPEEMLFDLGQLTEKINNYGVNSLQVETFKDSMQAKYGIARKSIKSNYYVLQAYIHK